MFRLPALVALSLCAFSLMCLPSTLNAQVPSYVPSDGLVLFMSFDGNVNDVSGNGNDGSTAGTVTYQADRFGNPESALSLSGNASNHVDVNYTPSFSFSEGFTMTAWFKTNTLSGDRRILQMGNTDSSGQGFHLMKSDDSMGAVLKVGGPYFGQWSDLDGPTSIATDNWHHVALTADFTSSEWKIYIDSELARVDTSSTSMSSVNAIPLNYNATFEIGKKAGSSYNGDAWNGELDDIGFWNRALAPDEITSLFGGQFTAGCTDSTACNFDPDATLDDGSCDFSCYPSTPDLPDFLPATDLLVWIPVEGEASNVIDNQYSAFMSNGAGLGPDRFGNPNSAVDLPGMIQIPNSGDLWADDFTFTFWTRKDANLGHNVIQVGEIGGALQYSAGWTSLNGGLDANGSPRLYLGPMNCSGGYSPGAIRTECISTSGDWMHVAFVYQSDTLSIYKNGQVCDYSNVPDGSLSFNCFSDDFGTYIGGDIGGGVIEYYNGAFDDIAIYSRGLSDLEVLSIFNETTVVLGCTDSTACNFDPEASLDDSSCIPAGCMDEDACNYNPDAGCDNGNCDFSCCPGPGCCGPGMSWDHDNQVCVTDYPTDINQDGCTTAADLVELLSFFGYCDSDLDSTFVGDTTAVSWACGDPLAYWGYDYTTVQIGGQCWFAENLRASAYRNGSPIENGLSDQDWASTTLGATTIYGLDSPECVESVNTAITTCSDAISLDEYGRLYNWYAVNDPRNLCPESWHVPSEAEWLDFIDWGAINLTSGCFSCELKTTTDWSGGNGSNSLGWNGKAGGTRIHLPSSSNGYWDSGYSGFWWTATESSASGARSRWMGNGNGVFGGVIQKKLGLSVRCLKDE